MFITRIILIIILILSGSKIPMELQINNYFCYAESIVVYEDSKYTEYLNTDDNYQIVLDALENLCENSHEMPAFGVSLHNETIIAKNSGLWIELIFNRTIVHNDMPFTKLLIEVNSDYSGFNIIRFYDDKYEGRCFYLDLDKNMSELNNLIKSI